MAEIKSAILTPADIPFDVGFHFDDELRDVPNDPDAMHAAVAWLIEKHQQSAPGTIAAAVIASLLGIYCRMIGRLPEAETYLKTAIETFKAGEQIEKWFVANLRLATVFLSQKRFGDAEGLLITLDKAAVAEPRVESYRHFVWQHRGKWAFDQARFVEARDDFARALVDRQSKGLKDLIDSSKLALSVAEKRLKAAPQ
jgi:predicted negative regulator of RcsB-dependent stress response